MGERETAVDFRFGGIFWRKKFVKILLIVDLARVVIAKLLRAVVKIFLDQTEDLGRALNTFLRRHKLPRFRRLIPATHGHGIFFEIAWTDLNPQWHAFLDPFPILHPAA